MPADTRNTGRGAFAAVGRFSYRFRWIVIGVWVALFALGIAATTQLGNVLKGGGFVNNGSSSVVASRVIQQQIPTGFTSLEVVFNDPHLKATDTRYKKAVTNALKDLQPGDVRGLKQVITYLNSGESGLVSGDAHTTVALLVFNLATQQVQPLTSEVRAKLRADGLTAYVTGAPAVNADITTASAHDLKKVELYALPVAVIALLFVFGTLVAAAMPVITGGVAVTVTLGIIYLLAHVTDVSIFAMNVSTLLGLAVGIDYALFIVARFREELHLGASVGDAVQTTVAHAGRSVYYSGLAVAAGILGLTFFPFPALRSIGIAGAIVVVVSVLAAATLLPAVLGVLGPRVNRLQIVHVHPGRSRFWQRWSGLVVRRPVVFTLIGLAGVAIIAWPVAGISMAMPTATVLPKTAESRLGYELIRRDFNMGTLSPISVAVTWPSGSPFSAARLIQLSAYGRQLEALPGVKSVTSIATLPGVTNALELAMLWQAVRPALQTGKPVTVAGRTITAAQLAQLKQLVEVTVGKHMVVYRVAPKADPESAAASDVVSAIKALTPPSGTSVYIAGDSAGRLDFFNGLYDRFPYVAIFVLGITYIILMLLSRSLVVPIKGLLTNILTILMSYGAIVFVFQDGRLQGLLGYTSIGAVDATMPIIMFCVLFGISMDYEVFLITRMRETWDRTHDVDASVSSGLIQSGRVIVSAAALVVIIAISFAFTSISVTKELGIGIAVAIIGDALFVRMMLVPALMRLLGRAAWWLPKPLQPLLPRVHFE